MLLRNGKILSYLNLTLTAAIWGFAFVAQRSGLESLDPFTFNALRFRVLRSAFRRGYRDAHRGRPAALSALHARDER